MKFLHLSDLHLGKKLGEYSMIEEQKKIINEIIMIIENEHIDAVLIAGDVFDKAIPQVEAVILYDKFLVELQERKLKVFIISGNHDSAERLSCGGRIMRKSDFYISPTYRGETDKIQLEDQYGVINIYLQPFIKPSHVRHYHEDAKIESYTDAMKYVIDQMNINKEDRNILVAHQFVAGAIESESEEKTIGGLDGVSAEVFCDFDYVALGHLHRPQNVTSNVRYSGTPLKYSFSEANNKKSVTIVNVDEKGSVKIDTRDLNPTNDLREIRGTYEELSSKKYYDGTNVNDYLHITLTDEEDIPYAISKLRAIYPNILKLDYDNRRTQNECNFSAVDITEDKTPMELFEMLFKKQNNTTMNEEQIKYMTGLIEEIWEDNK